MEIPAIICIAYDRSSISSEFFIRQVLQARDLGMGVFQSGDSEAYGRLSGHVKGFVPGLSLGGVQRYLECVCTGGV